jgi:AraC-like DNA-binding protein
MLTARLAEEHKVEGLRSGADDYITKPFNLDMLMLKVERIVEKSGSHEETQNREPEVESAETETTRQYSVRDEKLVERATFYINENISKIDLTVEELSESLGISRVHLYKKILGVTGMTPLELIRALRVERGKHLLRDSQLNVSEVAYMVGFNSPRYFSKYFKDMYGMLPSEYQKNHCTK